MCGTIIFTVINHLSQHAHILHWRKKNIVFFGFNFTTVTFLNADSNFVKLFLKD